MTDQQTEQPPQAGPDGTPQTPEGDPQGLGEGGVRALQAERTARAEAERQLRELTTAHQTAQTQLTQYEQQTQALTGERDAALHESLRYRVALTEGVPAPLAARLQGADEAALIADAASLRGLIGPSAPVSSIPRADPSQGSRTPASTSPEAAFAAAMKPFLNP